MASIDTHTTALSSRPARLAAAMVVTLCAAWVGLLFMLARLSSGTLGEIYGSLLFAHVLVLVVCILSFNPVLIGRRA